MLDTVKITGNSPEVLAHIKTLPEKYVRPAIHQAINTTLRNSRVEFSKRVRARVSVKSKTVKDAMKETRASRETLEASIAWRFEPLSLKAFGGVRQSKKGVAVTVMKGRRGTIKSAFISNKMGGHVFRREGEKRRPRKGKYVAMSKKDGSPYLRQPVKKLFGPSMLSQAREIMPAMQGWVNERMVENTRQAANRYLTRAMRAQK